LTTAFQFQNLTIENAQYLGIYVKNVEMPKEIVVALVSTVCVGRANNSIHSVHFINTNLCGGGIVLLSTLVQSTPELQYFYLRDNRIDDMNSALCLSRALKLHPRMRLDMSHCDLGNDLDTLSVILQLYVEEICLSHNNIDSRGAVKISEYLGRNPPLKSLNLHDNSFNDDDAILLSRSLKENTHLRRLNLQWNNFTPVGAKALFATLFDDASLNAISESNHTCALDIFLFSAPFQRLLFQLNGTLDRKSKILIALDDRESIVKYLADMPVGLMPYMLAFIQREGGEMQSMNIMYTAMRWCNMPAFCSFRHCVSFRIPHNPPAGSLRVLHAPARRGETRRASKTKINNRETDEFVSNPPFSKIYPNYRGND
jgi:hypothetical protein